jgi:hypothetical protein
LRRAEGTQCNEPLQRRLRPIVEPTHATTNPPPFNQSASSSFARCERCRFSYTADCA